MIEVGKENGPGVRIVKMPLDSGVVVNPSLDEWCLVSGRDQLGLEVGSWVSDRCGKLMVLLET